MFQGGDLQIAEGGGNESGVPLQLMQQKLKHKHEWNQ